MLGSMSSAQASNGIRPDVETTPLLRERILEETDNDLEVINWDGPNDPENPLNWSPRKRWANLILLSYMTFLT